MIKAATEDIRVYDNALLNAQRKIGDPIADFCITELFANPEKKRQLQNCIAGLIVNSQLKELPDSVAGKYLFYKTGHLPKWADQKLMRAGAAFFATHADAVMSLLGLLSLPYCYAAADGAMVLYLSDKMRNDTGKRLYETAKFVWDVMAPDAFSTSGRGFASILKVRFIHAMARYYTQKSPAWDMAWGLPVNQEDMAGTNLSFSLIVIRGLRGLGYSVRADDQHAFLHLWNVIGYLLGIDEMLLPANSKQAQQLEKAISKRQFKASEQGQVLTASLTNLLAANNPDPSFSKNDILGLMRHLLGNEVASILKIDAPALSSQKINLLQAVNLWNDIKPKATNFSAYRESYYKFKQQKPMA